MWPDETPHIPFYYSLFVGGNRRLFKEQAFYNEEKIKQQKHIDGMMAKDPENYDIKQQVNKKKSKDSVPRNWSQGGSYTSGGSFFDIGSEVLMKIAYLPNSLNLAWGSWGDIGYASRRCEKTEGCPSRSCQRCGKDIMYFFLFFFAWSFHPTCATYSPDLGSIYMEHSKIQTKAHPDIKSSKEYEEAVQALEAYEP